MQCLSLEGSFVGTNWIFTPSTNYQGQMDFCHTTVQFSEHSLSVTVLCWRRCRWSISKRNTGPMLRSNNKNAERIWVDQVYYAVVQQKLMTWYNFVDNAGFVFIWFWFEKWSNLFFIVDITSKEITLTLEIASFQQIFEEWFIDFSYGLWWQNLVPFL